jgi:hypothetical protein
LLAAIAGSLAIGLVGCRRSAPSRPSEPAAASTTREASRTPDAAAPNQLVFDDARELGLLDATDSAIFMFREHPVAWQPDGGSEPTKDDRPPLLVVVDADLRPHTEHEVSGIVTGSACSTRFVWSEVHGKVGVIRQIRSVDGPVETLASLEPGEGASNIVCAGDEIVACVCTGGDRICKLVAYGTASGSGRVVASNQKFPGMARVRAGNGFVYWVDESKRAILRSPLSGGPPTPFASLPAADANLFSLAISGGGLIWTNESGGEPLHWTVRFLPDASATPQTLDTDVDSFDRQGRWRKNRRLYQLDPGTRRPVELASDVDGSWAVVGHQVVALRHVMGVGSSPGHHVLERIPMHESMPSRDR